MFCSTTLKTLGTLFRLPLRTAAQAESSLLSKRALSTQEAEILLEALRQEASQMLLFLKNIENIEICHWDHENPEKQVIFHCGIMNITTELRNKRAFVGKCSDQNAKNVRAVDFTLNISCVGGKKNEKSVKYQEDWEVCCQLGGGSSDVIASEPSNALLRLIPWGGVAVCITPQRAPPTQTKGVSSVDLLGLEDIDCGDITANTDAMKDITNDNDDVKRPGLAYCFLPLPILTGLPVMVNGFFELSSNRRDIWQSGQSGGGEMTGDGRTRAEWNLSLMRDVIAPSYVRLLVRARDILGFSTDFQRLFPSSVPAPWGLIVESTLKGCAEMKLLLVESEKSTVPSSSTLTIKPTGAVSGVWVACSKAVLLPVYKQHERTLPLSMQDEEVLSRFLLEAGEPFVRCITQLRDTLSGYKTCDKMAVPAYVRNVLRRTNNSGVYVPTAAICSTFLLQYCISDLDPSSAVHCAELDSLRFLPLRGGGVGTLRVLSPELVHCVGELCSMGYSRDRAVWALTLSNFNINQACELLMSTSERSLFTIESDESYNRTYGMYVLANTEVSSVFSGAGALLMDCSKVSHIVSKFLEHQNVQELSNLKVFEASFIPTLLRLILPSECYTGNSVTFIIGNTVLSTGTGTGAGSGGDRTKSIVMTQAAFSSLLAFLPSFWSYGMSRDDIISCIADGPAIVPFLSLPSPPLPLPLPFPLLPSPTSSSLPIKTPPHPSLTDDKSVSTPLGSLVHMSPLSRMFSLLADKKDDFTLPSAISSILQKTGVRLVDFSLLSSPSSPSASTSRTFWEYVQSPHRSGILEAIGAAMRNQSVIKGHDGSTGSTGIVWNLTGNEREVLRQHLSSCEPVQSLSGRGPDSDSFALHSTYFVITLF